MRLDSGGSTAFLKQRSATVTSEGTWSATFDFSRIDPGTSFAVTVKLSSSDEQVAYLENAEVVEE